MSETNLSRFKKLKDTLEKTDKVPRVCHTEEFIPPHKVAGFCPYDAIVFLDNSGTRTRAWTESRVKSLFTQHEILYDELINIEPSKTHEQGDVKVFVSLS